ncbi:MAG TPA: toxin-antitoxin system HicB family antitoxin [Solirubrobacteraceae bacterium]|nr:toxin-antitoxin system HicB family antitoxin [Solirubrobacteraceae bacterium]
MATAETEAATSHSGKLLVRMPRTLHADLAAAADREGVSLNAFIVGALGGAVAWRADAPAPGAPPPVASPSPAAAASAQPRPVTASRTLSVALVVNLVVVVLAAAAAVALVIAAWPG